ncbi:MAG: hypothetical protein EAZ60_02400 [Oscillatoriales cyanobacterium]|nr:MAG: hypothetical protein EAZ60_02400 [Oscillatoriales cyanobacterium]
MAIAFALKTLLRPVSANWPVLVQFDKKFRAHFKEDEVELVSAEA